MNLEFLQALINKQENKEAIPLNLFQQEYALAAQTLETATEQVQQDVDENLEYQHTLKRLQTIPRCCTRATRQAGNDLSGIVDATCKKYRWHKENEKCLSAAWWLMTAYAEYVTALPGCPKEIRDLFNCILSKERMKSKEIMDIPKTRSLLTLAMNTQWSLE